MKRRGILLVFLLMALGVSALAVDPNQLYKGVPMFSQVTLLANNNPVYKLVNWRAKVYRVTLTPEFREMLRSHRDFVWHKYDGAPPPDGNPYQPFEITKWVNPFWVSMADGVSVTLNDTPGDRWITATLTPNTPLQWMFALCSHKWFYSGAPTEEYPRDWGAVDEYIDEVVEFLPKDGTIWQEFLVGGESSIRLTDESGCSGISKWIQTVPTDTTSIRGTWRFKTMSIHAQGVTNSERVPVYEYRNGRFYGCQVEIE